MANTRKNDRPFANFKIFGVTDEDDPNRSAKVNVKFEAWKLSTQESGLSGNRSSQINFSRCAKPSKESYVSSTVTSTPESVKGLFAMPKAPIKPRNRITTKADIVPKKLEFLEAEDENIISLDSNPGPASTTHRYPTRNGRVDNVTEKLSKPKNFNEKLWKQSTKSNGRKKLPDFDKENDASIAMGRQTEQSSSCIKTRIAKNSQKSDGLQNRTKLVNDIAHFRI